MAVPDHICLYGLWKNIQRLQSVVDADTNSPLL
jgi:hypothetical protein